MAEEDVVAGLWHNLTAKLSSDSRVTPQFMGFLSLVEPKGVLGETIYLEVSNDGTRNMIDQRLRPIIIEHLSSNSDWGGPVNFAIVVNPAMNPIAPVAEPSQYSFAEPAPLDQGFVQASAQAYAQPVAQPMGSYSSDFQAPMATAVGITGSGSVLNPAYTFDNFVIGESNRMAHAAALAVAEAPGKAYKPLFVYGNSGLGKTHLLHAIGNYSTSLYPRIRVRYVNSEEFTNDYINALRDQTMAEFQNQYRAIDVLLIDDIQFLAGKEGTQEAFFHLFNMLHNNDKQVVITSDLPPKELAGFEDRLISRFSGGLSADIQSPTLETRIAILRKKVERENRRVPDEVLEYIATRVPRNIRELEGALTQVVAWSSLSKQPIDMTMVQTVLKGLVAIANDDVTTPTEVMNAVAAYFQISIDDLTGSSRKAAIAQARQVAMYLCRQMTPLSLPAIGQQFGNRDHTTVLHACRKIEQFMSERLGIYNQVTELIGTLNRKTR